MSSPKEAAKSEISKRIERYRQVLSSNKIGEYSEADVGSQFIRPLLKALDWDIEDIEEVKEQKQTITGPVDYALNLYNKSVVLVEIKRFDENLDGYRIVRGGVKETHAQQALRYAWSIKVDWVILSNFAETRLYYSHVRNPDDGLVFKLKFNQYLDDINFNKLWIVSKQSVRLGQLSNYEKVRQRRDIDEEILADLIDIREKMTSNISIRNPDISKEEVNESTQKILNRLLFMRRCEDSSVIPREYLWTQFDNWQKFAINKSANSFMSVLKSAFRDFDAGFNGKIFDPHFSEDLNIDNDVLKKIIEKLYNYNFSWIPIDILGNAYELYIGTIIKEKQGKLNPQEVSLVEDPSIRKKFGIYYTPTEVVDFIIANTLGERLSKIKSPEEISKIKVIDPAAGSGTFLIRAYDHFYKWYTDYNKNNQRKDQGMIAYGEQIPFAKKRILLDNLYGIDLDSQAVEIIMLNLGLESIELNDKLPHLYDKIRWGNSVIGYLTNENIKFNKKIEILELRKDTKDLDIKISKSLITAASGDDKQVNELRKQRDSLIAKQEKLKDAVASDLNTLLTTSVSFDDIASKKPFHWEAEFPEVFKEGGFDVVIANPPYFNIQTIEDQKEKDCLKVLFPDVFSGESDIHYFFYTRGIQILREGGDLGFISSRYFIEAGHAEPLRKFLQENTRIKMIIDFGSVVKVFRDATVNTVVTILEKCEDKQKISRNNIKTIKVNDWDDDLDKLINHISIHQRKREYQDSFISVFELPQQRLQSSMWVLTPRSASEIFQKMKSRAVPLSRYCNVFKSIESGLDQTSKDHIDIAAKASLSFNPPISRGEEVFRVTEQTIKQKKLEKIVCKQLLKNQDVRRYLTEWRNEYLIFLTKDSNIDDYPNIKKHLSRYKPLLERRYDSVRSGVPWYAISNLRNIDKILSKKEKLLTPYISPENRFAFISGDEEWIYSNDVYVVHPKDDCPVSLKFILGILNSSLLEFFHKRNAKEVDGAAMTSKDVAMKRYSYQSSYLDPYPILIPTEEEIKTIHDPIVLLVDQISDLRKRWNQINLDFDRYLMEPIAGTSLLRRYIEKLSVNDKLVNDRTTKASIKRMTLEKDDDWLIFKVDCIVKKNVGKEILTGYEVARYRFTDEIMREFIYQIISNYKGKLRAGVLLSIINEIEMPLFSNDFTRHLELLKTVMKPFLTNSKKKHSLEQEIKSIDKKIDSLVYQLYGLSPEEIALIEDSRHR